MAQILPLDGKYYGTKIQISVDNGSGSDEMVVWTPDHFAEPFASEREIANGWNPADGHDHVEDVQSYKIAQIICEALTEKGY
jgi:hypothetical protein